MVFDFDELTRSTYIDEIRQFKEFLMSNVYKDFSLSIDKEIKLMKKTFEIKCCDLSDLEYGMERDEFCYSQSLKMLSKYRFISMLYMGLFSIWELQTVDYKGISTYYNDRMKEFALVVNTLKHSKKPNSKNNKCSYRELKAMNSKYLNPKNDFDKIISNLHGGEILDLSIADLIELCDEIISIWRQIKKNNVISSKC